MTLFALRPDVAARVCQIVSIVVIAPLVPRMQDFSDQAFGEAILALLSFFDEQIRYVTSGRSFRSIPTRCYY